MEPQVLVVSDPPHGKADPVATAEILGLEVDNASLKIGFPAPEVLKASDPERAVEVADSLRDAGLSVAVIDGRELAEVPWPAPVSLFGFGNDGLLARRGDEEIGVPYDVPLLAVYCRPPADFTIWREGDAARGPDPGSEGLAIAEAIEWMTMLDLYFRRGIELQRISIVQDVVDFAGLGDMRRPTDGESMAYTVEECERRFERIELDRRLENVRPRRRFLAGDAGFDMDLRKLYSFGTLLLRQALDSISPELRDVPQYELGSRLSYVLSRHRRAP